jgi:hypothetical protein
MAERHFELWFEVGETERHNMAFRFDQLFEPRQISVEGPWVTCKFELFSLKRVGRYESSVDSSEPHEVRIEEEAQGAHGGFQAQECLTHVDGRVIGRYWNAP